MRYDININLVLSIEVETEWEAEDIANKIASRMEVEAEWVSSAALTSPAPLAVVEGVTRVGA